MNKLRHAAPAILVVALTVGLAACGSSGGPPIGPAKGNPLNGRTGAYILAQSLANTEATPTMHIRGTVVTQGATLDLDLTFARGQGCEGTSGDSSGSGKIIEVKGAFYFAPPDSFFKSVPGGAAALPRLRGKYLKATPGGALIQSFGQLCQLPQRLPTMAPDSKGIDVSGKMTFNGQPAMKITRHGSKGYAWVSDTARPVVLGLSQPGEGDLEFSGYNAPVTITPPPANEVLDGRQFGA